jgi:cytochrome c553
MIRNIKNLCLLSAGALSLIALPGCDRQGQFAPVDMWNRSRLKPYESIEFFDNRTASRSAPAGTVARGQLYKVDDALYRGIGPDGRFINAVPGSISRSFPERALLQRGQERYQIYCAMCHGYTGHGNGMVVQRGFVPPPDYRVKRLRDAPLGHFYDVITNGYGAMYSYSSRVPLQDRWAIAAYVRRLQQVDPKVVEDVRYRRENGRPQYGSSNNSNAAPQGRGNTIGTAQNQGSQSKTEGGDMPGPKNPTQALPDPGPMATPGLNDGTRSLAR